jgi:hypothetical protein
MNIEQMSDRKLEDERISFQEWIIYANQEERDSGEVESWGESLKLIDAEIKERQEEGVETR